jgi:RNA recognition motif-containing protein
MTNIYVRNLSFQTTQGDLQAMFSRFGNVERVSLVTDPYNGQSRGFAFVEMTQPHEAQKAISQLNGTDLHGRILNVSEARPKSRRGLSGARKSSRSAGW